MASQVQRNQVVVSMNMFDYEQTPIYRTYELIKLEAPRYGVPVVGSELVDTLPHEAQSTSGKEEHWQYKK